ncbi:MAG: hypothetical protein ETSY1_00905 [Candidatus Entotheonella factor]|uniref:DUF433 domain-containing protein n=2 Tax=Candidatus Entotheonella TaxID=93171 RepID=W4LZP1_ENTF1|nr:MAG: hypothetical protein ETSY1_00905 [Candidatus Entotheonella factor]
MQSATLQLVREVFDDTVYEYFPIGQYIVAAPEICGGRPTFKYTRLEVATILDLIAAGWTVERLVQEYAQSHLTAESISEAVHLAKDALVTTTARTQRAT